MSNQYNGDEDAEMDERIGRALDILLGPNDVIYDPEWRPIVSIYEDNGGQIFLHADGGTALYRAGDEPPADEAEYVALYPDGADGNWSPEPDEWPGDEWATPANEVRLIAWWDQGELHINEPEHIGLAGRRYLRLEVAQ